MSRRDHAVRRLRRMRVVGKRALGMTARTIEGFLAILNGTS
jgi:hypothetical protein